MIHGPDHEPKATPHSCKRKARMHELTFKAFLHFRPGIIARFQGGHFLCLNQTAPTGKLGGNHLIALFLSFRHVHAETEFDTAIKYVYKLSLNLDLCHGSKERVSTMGSLLIFKILILLRMMIL